MIKIGLNEIYLTDTDGDKPALLFVHGIMMNSSVWRKQVEAFSNDCRVVCVDLRGFGQSTTNDPNITMEDHADDMAQVIKQLELRDVTFIGWSMGGAIGQVFAAAHGELISKLVLVDTTPQLLATEEFSDALPPEAAQQLGGQLVEDFTGGCAAFCGMIAPESADIAAELTAIASATRPDVALTAFQISGGMSLLSTLPAINTPTWVVAGVEDGVCFPAASTYLAANIPGCASSSATFLENAGHAPFLTQTEAFNTWLKSVIA